MEYIVIQEPNYSIFAQNVRRVLKQGYKPQGGISISPNKTDRSLSKYYYAQAFVR